MLTLGHVLTGTIRIASEGIRWASFFMAGLETGVPSALAWPCIRGPPPGRHSNLGNAKLE